MCQITFLSTLDTYGVKNRLIRYLWMLKSPIFSYAISQILKNDQNQ